MSKCKLDCGEFAVLRKAIVAVFLFAAWSVSAAVYNVKDFGADGTDGADDFPAFRKALKQAAGAAETTEVRVPAGTYHLSSPMSIYSDTTLTLSPDAKIVAMEGCGGLLRGQHVDEAGGDCPMDATCDHGGYTQISNVVVQGGIWDCAADQTRVVYGIRIVHGSRIAIRDLHCTCATDHNINLSGCAECIVSNVTFTASVEYTGDDPGFWSGTEVGNPLRYGGIEAVHLDYIEQSSEGESYPVDGTVCRDILVADCKFDGVFAGVGTHHMPEGDPAERITVRSCDFANLRSYAMMAYGYTNCVFSSNNVAGGTGALLSERAGVFFIDNAVSGSGQNAVRVQSAGSVVSCGNIIDSPAANGFCADGGSGVVSVQDEVLTPGEYGFYVAGGFATVCEAVVDGAKKSAVSGEAGAVVSVTDSTLSNPMHNGITVISGDSLYASGNMIFGAGRSGMSVSASCADILGNTIETAGVHGLQISGGKACAENNSIVACGAAGFCAEGGSDCTAVSNTFERCGSFGAVARGASSAVLEGNTFSEPGAAGVFASDADTKISACGNGILSATGDAFRAEKGASIKATGNFAEWAGGNGFYAADASSIVAEGNEIDAPAGHGACLLNAEKCEFRGNVITGVSGEYRSGVYMSGVPSAYVHGNMFEDVAGRGVYATGCTNCTISANTIRGTRLEGVYLSGLDGAVVCSNLVESTGFGIRLGSLGGEIVTADVFMNDVSSASNRDILVCSSLSSRILGNVCRTGGWAMEKDGALRTEIVPADARITSVELLPTATAEMFRVSWEPLAGVDGYIVEYASTDDFSNCARCTVDKTVTYYDFVPEPGGGVYVRVVSQACIDPTCVTESARDPAFAVCAGWRGTYAVRCKANGGAGADFGMVIPAGVSFPAPDCTFCGCVGGVFAGWGVSSNALEASGSIFRPGDEVSFAMDNQPESLVELYAQWTNGVAASIAGSCAGRCGVPEPVNVDELLSSAPQTDFLSGFVLPAYDPTWEDSEPVNPEPVDPEPVDPEPVDPEPVDPEPVDPEPVDPEPVDPGDDEPESPDLYSTGDDSPFAGNVTYVGWVRDGNGSLAGVLTVKTGKAKRSDGTCRPTVTYVPFGGKKQKIAVDKSAYPVAGGDALLELPGIGTIRLNGTVATGVDVDVQAGADLSKSKDRDAKAVAKARMANLAGTWTFALETAAGNAAFSVTVSSKGKGKLVGTMPDGSKVSISSQGVLGESSLAIPFAYSKKGAVGFVFWVNEDRSVMVSDATDLRMASGAAYSVKPVEPSPMHALSDGDHFFDCEFFAEPVQFSVAGKKWVFPRQNKRAEVDPNPYKAKLMYNQKTGVVKGSFSAAPAGYAKEIKFTVNGVVVGSKFCGAAFSKKYGGVAVSAE